MKKFCVFCGQSPQEKNKEHVIPQWLIKLTGDPKRTAAFGLDFGANKPKVRQFSFDALTFPACTTCNESFSKLETLAEAVVRALISNQGLSMTDFNVLLDWLDKVRVGLWLGYLYLDKNPLGIDPSFHIEARVGRLDRMVSILTVADGVSGLSFSGTDSRFYQLSPTCLAIRINGHWLINASGISLCSQRLGFPFAQPLVFNENNRLEVSLHHGSGRPRCPVERFLQLPNVVSLYQPVFSQFLVNDGQEFLENDWVRRHTADTERGLGKLFVQKDGALALYPERRSPAWIPTKNWQTWEVVDRVPPYVYDRLRRDFVGSIPLGATSDLRKHMRKQAGTLQMLDRAVLKRIKEVARKLRER